TCLGPGSISIGGSTARYAGDDASTRAGTPATVTRFASASPQKPWPVSSNRSLKDATRGAAPTSNTFAGNSLRLRIVLDTRPLRPWIPPEIVPTFSGATNIARPVALVVNLSPLENTTVTPGVNRPFTSSTASV